MIPPKTNFFVAWRSTFLAIRMHFPFQESSVCMYTSMYTFLIAMAYGSVKFFLAIGKRDYDLSNGSPAYSAFVGVH